MKSVHTVTALCLLATTIKDGRKRDGISLTQAKLALALGCHSGYIARLERGTPAPTGNYPLPSADLVQRMAEALELDPVNLKQLVEDARRERERIRLVSQLIRFEDSTLQYRVRTGTLILLTQTLSDIARVMDHPDGRKRIQEVLTTYSSG